MSDDMHDRATGGIHVSEAAEAAKEAGAADKLFSDPVKEFELDCKLFIERSRLTSEHRAQALTKLAEMCFWIRAGYGRV